MDLIDPEKVQEEVKQTIAGLAIKEGKNEISFTEWPKTPSTNRSTPYKLLPERR